MTDAMLTTADGRPLKEALQRSQRMARRRAFLLVLPLLAFLTLVFIIPIAAMIRISVTNPEISQAMPNGAAALNAWDGVGDLPPESVFAALALDLAAEAEKPRSEQLIGRAAARVNREIPGARSGVLGTMRKIDRMEPPWRDAFVDAHKIWSNPGMWQLLKRETRTITPTYYLLAMDRRYADDGTIEKKPENQRVYGKLFARTAWMSLAITSICILLAYPISYMLATQPLRIANMLMILVLLPFWTSLLVRTSAWIVLLQREGVVNDIIVSLGLFPDDARPQMIYNATGTMVAMVHILLPFMVLPLYSVMKTIDPSYMRAANSLGSHPFRSWWKVYFPLTLPGMAAGVMLVFILAIGYYITPALVGGETGIFISNIIADNMQDSSANQRLAAALSTLLLVGVLILYWVFNKLVGVDRLKFG